MSLDDVAVSLYPASAVSAELPRAAVCRSPMERHVADYNVMVLCAPPGASASVRWLRRHRGGSRLHRRVCAAVGRVLTSVVRWVVLRCRFRILTRT